MGTVTGAWATPSLDTLADLAGKGVAIWPDADDEGRAHMARIAQRLHGIAAWVRQVDWPDAPPKGDAADIPAERIRELVDGALAGPELAAQPATAARAESGIDAAELLELQLPPLLWLVPDLLPEGTSIVAAPPKVGKSCLVYQIASEVAIGGQLFGRRVASGAVLYYALEDGRRRGQERLRAALAGRTMPRGRLEIRWSSPKIGEGLEEEIAAWLDEHPDAALVAIDTLARVRPRSSGKRGAYEIDVEDLGRLQAVCRDRSVALLIVHHSKKDAGDDFLASVSGTYGITGSVDTIIVVQRIRMEAFGKISVTGREVAEAELPVRFDGMLWHEAPASLPEASFARAEVYQAIVEHGPIWPAAIAKRIGHESRTSVQNMTTELYKDGAVLKTLKGYTAVDREHEPADARRRVHVPDDSNDWESHLSQGGHTRARTRDRASMPTVHCQDYTAHRDAHRQIATGQWLCARCEAQA